MNNVNHFARGIWKDLVDKRLWPVALGLVIALIAIPVVLAKPAPKTSPASAPVVTTASNPEPLVATPAAIRSNTGAVVVGGKFKDPFHQQHVPKPPKTDTGGDKASGSSGDITVKSGDSSGGSSSGGSSGSSGGSSTKQTVKKLRIRFGKANGQRKVREVTPGTPLPAASNPLIVFTDFGVDGKKPVFLLSSDVVKTEGDGSCKPSKDICAQMSLRPGDTQFFDVQSGSQYQLDVLGIVES